MSTFVTAADQGDRPKPAPQLERQTAPGQRKQKRAELDILPAVLKVRQAAQYLNVSVRTIYNLKERGELRSIGIGTAVRFRIADLDAFLEAHRR